MKLNCKGTWTLRKQGIERPTLALVKLPGGTLEPETPNPTSRFMGSDEWGEKYGDYSYNVEVLLALLIITPEPPGTNPKAMKPHTPEGKLVKGLEFRVSPLLSLMHALF